jgi:hypothetical protein
MKPFLTGSKMNDQSILKRTLILTGKLMAVFSIWVALVSVVATFAAGRMVVALSGGGADPSSLAPADATKKDEGVGSRIKHPPASVTGKPNG